MNIKSRCIGRVVTERAREERQNARDDHAGSRAALEEALDTVDDHDDDSMALKDLDLDVEETNMRQCGLLSDEPEDRDRPGCRMEAERSLLPRRHRRQASSLAEVAARNQRRHR